MARLVAAFGSSHSPMLAAQAEDWNGGFLGRDRTRAHVDLYGNPCGYEELLANAPADAQEHRQFAAVFQKEFGMPMQHERVSSSTDGVQQLIEVSSEIQPPVYYFFDRNRHFPRGCDNFGDLLVGDRRRDLFDGWA